MYTVRLIKKGCHYLKHVMCFTPVWRQIVTRLFVGNVSLLFYFPHHLQVDKSLRWQLVCRRRFHLGCSWSCQDSDSVSPGTLIHVVSLLRRMCCHPHVTDRLLSEQESLVLLVCGWVILSADMLTKRKFLPLSGYDTPYSNIQEARKRKKRIVCAKSVFILFCVLYCDVIRIIFSSDTFHTVLIDD
jgi:hypothetical protein